MQYRINEGELKIVPWEINRSYPLNVIVKEIARMRFDSGDDDEDYEMDIFEKGRFVCSFKITVDWIPVFDVVEL
jgi:hypothetical protein